MIATGWCDKPRLPDFADRLPAGVAQITPDAYRSPDELPPGGVLVVGGSATGVQLADELVRAGREVILSAGNHSRLPRRYRGMDIWWWLDQTGTFAVTIDEVSTAGPVPKERCSSSAVRTTATWTCRHCSASACGWPAGWSTSTGTG